MAASKRLIGKGKKRATKTDGVLVGQLNSQSHPLISTDIEPLRQPFNARKPDSPITAVVAYLNENQNSWPDQPSSRILRSNGVARKASTEKEVFDRLPP